jgi:hypothetical protein
MPAYLAGRSNRCPPRRSLGHRPLMIVRSWSESSGAEVEPDGSERAPRRLHSAETNEAWAWRRVRITLDGGVPLEIGPQLDPAADAHYSPRCTKPPESQRFCSVGATGFEPATFRPPAECATKLRHAPFRGHDIARECEASAERWRPLTAPALSPSPFTALLPPRRRPATASPQAGLRLVNGAAAEAEVPHDRRES